MLPRAQIDRFLLKEVIDYPSADEELEVLNRIDSRRARHTHPETAGVVSIAEVRYLIGLAARVYVDESVKRYAVAIAQATRDLGHVIDPELAGYVEFGASPAVRSRCNRPRGRSPCWSGAATSCPRTSVGSVTACCATGCTSGSRRSPTTCDRRRSSTP